MLLWIPQSSAYATAEQKTRFHFKKTAPDSPYLLQEILWEVRSTDYKTTRWESLGEEGEVRARTERTGGGRTVDCLLPGGRNAGMWQEMKQAILQGWALIVRLPGATGKLIPTI